MGTSLQTASLSSGGVLSAPSHETVGFVTMKVGGQLFGVSVLAVQDVIRRVSIARVPLAPKEISGSMNLRGRIVTVIDMRVRLGLEPFEDRKKVMHVVVEQGDELFSLMIDKVGDVLNLPSSQMEKPPANMDVSWRDVASGIYSLENELLVIVDVQSLLTF